MPFSGTQPPASLPSVSTVATSTYRNINSTESFTASKLTRKQYEDLLIKACREKNLLLLQGLATRYGLARLSAPLQSGKTTALAEATLAGHTTIIGALLVNYSVTPHANSQGRYPLYYAIKRKKKNVVKALYRLQLQSLAGKDPHHLSKDEYNSYLCVNKKGKSALEFSIELEKIETFLVLYKLHTPVQRRETLERLLEKLKYKKDLENFFCVFLSDFIQTEEAENINYLNTKLNTILVLAIKNEYKILTDWSKEQLQKNGRNADNIKYQMALIAIVYNKVTTFETLLQELYKNSYFLSVFIRYIYLKPEQLWENLDEIEIDLSRFHQQAYLALSPLRLAVACGHIEIAGVIFKNNAQFIESSLIFKDKLPANNGKFITKSMLILDAAANNQILMLEWLIEKLQIPQLEPLALLFAQEGYIKAFEWALKKIREQNNHTFMATEFLNAMLSTALQNSHTKIISWLIDNYSHLAKITPIQTKKLIEENISRNFLDFIASVAKKNKIADLYWLIANLQVSLSQYITGLEKKEFTGIKHEILKIIIHYDQLEMLQLSITEEDPILNASGFIEKINDHVSQEMSLLGYAIFKSATKTINWLIELRKKKAVNFGNIPFLLANCWDKVFLFYKHQAFSFHTVPWVFPLVLLEGLRQDFQNFDLITNLDNVVHNIPPAAQPSFYQHYEALIKEEINQDFRETMLLAYLHHKPESAALVAQETQSHLILINFIIVLHQQGEPIPSVFTEIVCKEIFANNPPYINSTRLIKAIDFTQEQQENLLMVSCLRGYVSIFKQLIQKYGLPLLHTSIPLAMNLHHLPLFITFYSLCSSEDVRFAILRELAKKYKEEENFKPFFDGCVETLFHHSDTKSLRYLTRSNLESLDKTPSEMKREIAEDVISISFS